LSLSTVRDVVDADLPFEIVVTAPRDGGGRRRWVAAL
jgi:hypothetical protein